MILNTLLLTALLAPSALAYPATLSDSDMDRLTQHDVPAPDSTTSPSYSNITTVRWDSGFGYDWTHNHVAQDPTDYEAVLYAKDSYSSEWKVAEAQIHVALRALTDLSIQFQLPYRYEEARFVVYAIYRNNGEDPETPIFKSQDLYMYEAERSLHSTVWIIIGCVFGGILLISVIVGIIICQRRKRRREREYLEDPQYGHYGQSYAVQQPASVQQAGGATVVYASAQGSQTVEGGDDLVEVAL